MIFATIGYYHISGTCRYPEAIVIVYNFYKLSLSHHMLYLVDHITMSVCF